ncbi:MULTISPECIES: alkaline phosphatase [Paenibacillus]|uniref:alkaline phosphatase n=1 Tax=Paenibacillus TaxID=44249 RepID=UPI0022B90051|nr:alkaline phosphatase [Paenibacillus caseinilyticus]MCZ8521067.1 alkaline phosphatase [Paenibacillus caseinilyticus]
MKKNIVKGMVASSLILSMIPAGISTAAGDTANTAVPAKGPASKNLIVLIGDGMGPAQVTAARYYSKSKLKQEHLNLDSYYVGQATTYADRGEDGGKVVSGAVTDSASAGTAFATGNKTYNAGISVSNEDASKPFASVIEAAEKSGKATGLVTTARITHATPAVFASHVRNRDNESAIASQYLDSGVDVLFGGGKQFFVTKDEKGKRTDKSLLPEFQAKGYQIVENAEGLQSLKSGKALGLFGSSHVAYTPDRDASIPSLANMTSKALELLSTGDKGFAMMIEGGRIDHASHANDFPTAVQEVIDFDAAVKVAMDFAKKDGNTSVVITADHETGGLSLSRDNIYELNIDLWDKQKKSSEALIPLLNKAVTADDVKKVVADNTWITDLSEEEAQFILAGDGSSYQREGAYNNVVAKRLLIGWSGHGHSAVDVGVWAYGPIADQVKGNIDNTQIAKASAAMIGVDLAAVSAEMQSKYVYPKFKITREGAVLYPAKALAERLGAVVAWDEASRSVKLSKGSQTLLVNVETGKVQQNGAESAYAANVDNGTLYLPLEAFNSLAGLKMTWDSLSERLVLQ